MYTMYLINHVSAGALNIGLISGTNNSTRRGIESVIVVKIYRCRQY